MRKQATDPLHMLEVVTTNGWDQMRWDRVQRASPGRPVHVIDTTELDPLAAASAVLVWIRTTTPTAPTPQAQRPH